MKDRKQILAEILDDVLKNQVSRELEVEHVENYLMPKMVKIKDKEERKVHVASLEDKLRGLKEEIEARKDLIKVIKGKLKA